MLSSKILTKQTKLFRAFTSWGHCPLTPPDPILGLNEKFKESTDPRKVNLTVGAYRDNNGKPLVLPSVKAAIQVLNSGNQDLEYIPIVGDKEFVGLN
jgi:aspartate aminotransferase